MKPDLVSGSPLWQTVFISFAAVLMLFQIARGWRLGLPRQLVRIGAVIAAYSAALWGGEAIVPVLRPLLKVPDFVLSALGGAVLAMIIYSIINTVGAILFKRTAQQSSSVVRLIFGGSGAVLGIFFGLFFVWLLVVGIRTLGAIAEAEINTSAPRSVPRFDEPTTRSRRAQRAVIGVDQNSFVFSLARLKKSIELGTFGELVKRTDILPSGIYETLGHVGEVFAQPERSARFLGYPGVTELIDNPKILALRADPEIANMIQQGRVLDLLQDERLVDTMNDPELRAELTKLNFKAAIEHALKQE